MQALKGQLTARGLIIGCIGCAIITAASAYVALKMGALPWPIVFAAIISLVFLKALSHGKANLNEANVTHTVMSSGAMVAGGLAFTIPGAWMLGLADEMSWVDILLVATIGVLLGLVCSVCLRMHFIEDANLEFPIGQSAAQTLIAGNAGGKVGAKLFGAMGLAGIYTALRDIFGVLPSMLFSCMKIPGVTFGIYNSPMMIAVGFLVGTSAMVVCFLGALLANGGIIWAGSSFGLVDVATAQGMVSSLGMGLMMGAGVAVIVVDVIPAAYRMLKGTDAKAAQGEKSKAVHRGQAQGVQAGETQKKAPVSAGAIALVVVGVAACALLLCFGLGLGPVASAIVVVLVWAACAMSAQSVGQTGIDPMEIFGLIVLLAVAATCELPAVKLFFVAGVIAVACGLAGDVMNDFFAGHVLGTSPKAQFIGQAVGSVIGVVVAVGVICALYSAYGADAFGPTGSFVAAQASVVANMVSGVASVPFFMGGLIAGFLLYCVKFPSMMLGLGVYLPFYMSLTAFIGAVVKLCFNAYIKHKTANAALCDQDKQITESEESGLIIASGLLGGESIIGIVAALIVSVGALAL